jgi:hypothetical protein
MNLEDRETGGSVLPFFGIEPTHEFHGACFLNRGIRPQAIPNF